MALTFENVDDFTETTLNRFIKRKWSDISLEFQEYCSSQMLKEKRIMERGGAQIEFKVQHKNTGNAVNTGLYATDVTAVTDVMINGQVPWTKQTTSWSYDIDEELFQSDPETIISELKIREHDAMNSLAELNEENLWTNPTSASDTRPRGIPHWIVRNFSAGAGALSGGDPTGFGTGGAAGIDSDTYPQWRNWTYGYTSVSPDDLVARTKKAIAFTHFMAPHPHPELGYSESNHYIYTTYRVQEPLERLAETRNDRLGSDVARYMNEVTLGGIPIKWVPYLETNETTTDPVYGVNYRVFRPYVKRGANMRRSGPKQAPRQNTVRNVFYDTWMNYACVNRRLCFVGSKA